MKIVQLLLLSAILILKSSFAWDCSRDCPKKDYETCKKEQNRNRELGIFEDPDDDDEDMHTAAAHDIAVEPMTNLRGSPMYLNNTSRDLGSSHFQVKMHWERLYCWQAETRERKWCWECRDNCNEGSKVEIDRCDSGEEDQRWVYKNAGGGDVRISPKRRPNLCMENRGGEMKLKNCDGNNSKQKLSGFKSNGGKFELWIGDNSKLISQGHDPKRHEKLKLVKKSTARGDHTNFWEVINKSGSSSSSGQSSSAAAGGSKNSRPPIDFRGSSYCTHKKRCSLCQGDCDDDESCEGNLVCRQRNAGESFGGCSGGGSDNSKSDYCVEP